MGGCASKNKYTVDADEAKEKDKKKEKKTKDKGKKKGDEKDEKKVEPEAAAVKAEDKKEKGDDDKTKENGGPPKEEDSPKLEATKTDDVHLSPRDKFFMETPTSASQKTRSTFPDLLAKSPGVTVTTSTTHRVDKGEGDKPDVNVMTTTTRRVGEEDGKRIDATGNKEESQSESQKTKVETITLPDGRTMEVTKMTTTTVKSEANVVRKKTTYVEPIGPDDDLEDGKPKVTVKKETVITHVQSRGDGEEPVVHTHTESNIEEMVLPEPEKEVEGAKVDVEVKEEVVQQEAAAEVSATPAQDVIVAETVETVESRPRAGSHSSSGSSDSSDDEVDGKKKEVEVPENFLEQFRQDHKLTAVEFMRTWKHYDKDRSGYMEGKELKRFLTDLLQSKDEKTDKKTIKRYGKYMMKEFDFNKDGKIDITELSQILSVEDNFLNKFPARITRTPEELDEIFKHYDEMEAAQSAE